jgi:hypothetical protein
MDVQTERRTKYNTHVIRLVIVLLAAGLLAIGARAALLPAGFGKYGHYRAGAVEDEARREIRNMTNDSCLACHPDIKRVHLDGVHKTVSCEFCHGPLADHVKDNQVIGKLPVKRDLEIKDLCLRCHNQIIRARPGEAIKMIAMPKHLEEKQVQVEHNCNQCHHVHSPMFYVKLAREYAGIKDETKETK